VGDRLLLLTVWGETYIRTRLNEAFVVSVLLVG